jgi:hypothetical protein
MGRRRFLSVLQTQRAVNFEHLLFDPYETVRTSPGIGNFAIHSVAMVDEAVHRQSSEVEGNFINRRRDMCRSLISALGFAFALTLATSAQAAPLMPLAPLHQPSDGIVTQARAACGLGYQRRAGVCVRNTTVRRTRRAIRRCRRWNGGVCIRYY